MLPEECQNITILRGFLHMNDSSASFVKNITFFKTFFKNAPCWANHTWGYMRKEKTHLRR